MIIAGCDFHSNYQQIAFIDAGSVEVEERSLPHSGAEAEQFYDKSLNQALLADLPNGTVLWIGKLVTSKCRNAFMPQKELHHSAKASVR